MTKSRLLHIPKTHQDLIQAACSTYFASPYGQELSFQRLGLCEHTNLSVMQVVSLVAKILPPVPVDAAPGPQRATKAAAGTAAPATTGEHAAADAPAGPADAPAPARAEAAFTAAASARAEAVAAAEAALTQRVAFLRDNASVLQAFGSKLLSQLMHVRHSSQHKSSPPTPAPTVWFRRRRLGNLGPDCCSHLLPMCVSDVTSSCCAHRCTPQQCKGLCGRKL